MYIGDYLIFTIIRSSVWCHQIACEPSGIYHFMTNKKCIDCGEPVPNNHWKRCLPCNKKNQSLRNHAWESKNKERRQTYEHNRQLSPARRYKLVKDNADRRDLSFTITLLEFEAESSKPCTYCDGALDTDIGKGGHLDRIDNSRGYESGNICSCCHTCNRLKQDLLSFEETKVVVQALIDFRFNPGH